MSSSLSKLVDNLSEGTHNNKCLDCYSCLDYIKIKNEKLLLKCFNCNTYYKKKFNKEIIKKIKNTYSFSHNDLNKFILLLRLMLRKAFILMNIWIVGKDLMRHHYQVKKTFIAT